MKIRGTEITITEWKDGRPFPDKIMVDGIPMHYCGEWENGSDGKQRISYRGDDNSLFLSRIMRKDLLRVKDGIKKHGIFWRYRDSREIFSDLSADYNTDNYTIEELKDLCILWEKEDEEDEDDPRKAEYFVDEVNA